MKLKLSGLICCVAVSLFMGGANARGEEQKSSQDQKSSIEVVKTGGLYTLKAQDARLSDILAELKKQSEINLNIDPQLLEEKHTYNLVDVSYEDIVKALAGSHALIYEKASDGEYRLISARLTGQQSYVPPVLPELSRKDNRTVSDKTKEVKGIIGQVDLIYGEVGEMDYDQAKALIADRNAKMKELVQQLIALGPGGARAMLGMYGEKSGTREQLAMIEALAYIDDPEAVNVLGKLFANETRYSMLREIIGSLGHRSGEEVNTILQNILDSQKDERLRAGVTQALSGRPEALDTLWAIIRMPGESVDVQSEAIRSMGLIKNNEAMSALTQIASSSAYNLTLRKSAIQELGRSFGGSSMSSLAVLMESPEESIRQSVVRSLSKVETPEAMEILQSVARNDSSATVRAHAEAVITSHGAVPASAN